MWNEGVGSFRVSAAIANSIKKATEAQIEEQIDKAATAFAASTIRIGLDHLFAYFLDKHVETSYATITPAKPKPIEVIKGHWIENPEIYGKAFEKEKSLETIIPQEASVATKTVANVTQAKAASSTVGTYAKAFTKNVLDDLPVTGARPYLDTALADFNKGDYLGYGINEIEAAIAILPLGKEALLGKEAIQTGEKLLFKEGARFINKVEQEGVASALNSGSIGKVITTGAAMMSGGWNMTAVTPTKEDSILSTPIPEVNPDDYIISTPLPNPFDRFSDHTGNTDIFDQDIGKDRGFTLPHSSLSDYIFTNYNPAWLKPDGTLIGTKGKGRAQEITGNADPAQAALDFIDKVKNGQDVIIEPLSPINGVSGSEKHTLPDGTIITYRPPGAAGKKTDPTTATVQINNAEAKKWNSGDPLKLKFTK